MLTDWQDRELVERRGRWHLRSRWTEFISGLGDLLPPRYLKRYHTDIGAVLEGRSDVITFLKMTNFGFSWTYVAKEN